MSHGLRTGLSRSSSLHKPLWAFLEANWETLLQRRDQHHLRSLMGQAGGMKQGYILMYLAEHPWLTNQLSPSIPLSLPPPSTLFLFLFPSSITLSSCTDCVSLPGSWFCPTLCPPAPSLKPPHALKPAGDELFRADWNRKQHFWLWTCCSRTDSAESQTRWAQTWNSSFRDAPWLRLWATYFPTCVWVTIHSTLSLPAQQGLSAPFLLGICSLTWAGDGAGRGGGGGWQQGRVPTSLEELPGTTSMQRTVDKPREVKFKDSVYRISHIPLSTHPGWSGGIEQAI